MESKFAAAMETGSRTLRRYVSGVCRAMRRAAKSNEFRLMSDKAMRGV